MRERDLMLEEERKSKLKPDAERERGKISKHIQWCERKIYKGDIVKNRSHRRKNCTKSSPSPLRNL
jgi:hypothetical protein